MYTLFLNKRLNPQSLTKCVLMKSTVFKMNTAHILIDGYPLNLLHLLLDVSSAPLTLSLVRHWSAFYHRQVRVHQHYVYRMAAFLKIAHEFHISSVQARVLTLQLDLRDLQTQIDELNRLLTQNEHFLYSSCQK